MSTDLSQLSNEELLAAAGPSPQTFAVKYGPAAQQAGQKLGVDPNVILAQWGHETGWGKSVIPGTNNLGNIKDPSGKGPVATDNANGSKDSYATYNTPNDFANSYADLISRRYPSAVGAGADINKFAKALKAGGYAEDPSYVLKLAGAGKVLGKVLGSVVPSANAADLSNSSNADLAKAAGVDLSKLSNEDLAAAAGVQLPQQQQAVAQAQQQQNPQQATQEASQAPLSKQQVLDLLQRPDFSTRFAQGGIEGLKRMAIGGNQMLLDAIAKIPGLSDYAKQAQAKMQQYAAQPQPQGIPEALGAAVNGAMTMPMLPGGATSMIGRAGMGAAGGALQGALQPAADPGERLRNMGVNAAIGGVVTPAIEVAGKVLQGVLNPAAQYLRDKGITPTMGQILGGGYQNTEDKLRSVPLLGDVIAHGQRMGIQEFNKAAYADALAPIGGKVPDTVGRDAIDNVRQQISDNYEKNILPNISFQVTPQVTADMGAAASKLQTMPQDVQNAFVGTINDINRQAKPTVSLASGWPVQSPGTLDGDQFKDVENVLNQQIKRFQGGNGYERNLADSYKDVLTSLRSNLQQQNPQMADALSANNEAWARYARIRAAGASVTGAKGDFIFSPAQMQQAVRQQDVSVGKGRFAGGNALGQDLADPAAKVLSQHYPDSGTPGRQFIGGLLTGGGALMAPQAVAGLGVGMLPYMGPGRSIAASALMDRPAAVSAFGNILRGASPMLGGGVAPVIDKAMNN